MSAGHNVNSWFEVLHESSSPFRLVTRPVTSDGESWDVRKSCLMPLLAAAASGIRQHCSHLIAGDSSVFDAESPNGEYRLMSVPVMYNGRSITLTRVHESINGNASALYGPTSSVLSRFLEKSPAAVCVVDPLSYTINAFNRKFVELWNIEADCFRSRYGLEYSVLTPKASAISRLSGDTEAFLRLDEVTDRTERILPLVDGNAMRVVFDAVGFNKTMPFRLIASFVREEISTARRRREFAAAFRQLSHRQSEVVQHVVDGRTNPEIAELLGISIKTIEKHRGMAMARLPVASLPELVRLVDFVRQCDGGIV